jgi:hypothetical protein
VSFYVWKCLDKPWDQIWALGSQNWGFGVKIEVFSRAYCHNSPPRSRGELDASSRGSLELARLASKVTRNGELHRAAPPISRSYFFFTRLCFYLIFGVNMEVLDNLVIFPKALVWHGNDFSFLSYEENTRSKFYETSA